MRTMWTKFKTEMFIYQSKTNFDVKICLVESIIFYDKKLGKCSKNRIEIKVNLFHL